MESFEEEEKIDPINKTFNQITQVMEVARALTTIPTKNDDQYI
jgi:hypothetical protein